MTQRLSRGARLASASEERASRHRTPDIPDRAWACARMFKRGCSKEDSVAQHRAVHYDFMTETSASIGVKRSNLRRPLTDPAAAVLSRAVASDLIIPPEWLDMCRHGCNALLVGPEPATRRLLTFLGPYLRRPTVWKGARHAPLDLPAGCGALVLQNVSALGTHDQAAVSRWLDTHRTQLISTSTQPLFPLIALGLFDEALYYRLNVMLLNIGRYREE